MRWARQQGATTCVVTDPPIIYNRWYLSAHGISVVSVGRAMAGMSTCEVRVEGDDRAAFLGDVSDGLSPLRVLAALDLIPAELAEDEPEPDGARGDAPLVAVTVVDVAETARRLFGGKGPAEFIAGRPLPEHDYRLKAKTPTGGEVSFHRGATADHVAEYWRREGWLPGVASC
jgi:hypothetical protein